MVEQDEMLKNQRPLTSDKDLIGEVFLIEMLKNQRPLTSDKDLIGEVFLILY